MSSLNQVITKKRMQALRAISKNPEVKKEFLGLLNAIKAQSMEQLVSDTNTVNIHRCQGAITSLDELMSVVDKPEVFESMFEKE